MAPALVKRYGKGTDSDATDTLIAAPLSHGSNPNSNMAVRRREDDENLVVLTGLQGILSEDASAQKANTRAVLRALRNEAGEETATEWGSRILDPLQSSEVLRSRLHGGELQGEAEEARPWLDDGALSRSEPETAGAVRTLRERAERGSPQERQLARQLLEQLGVVVPKLSHEGAPTASVRRLTPREAERLQGFPDDWTQLGGTPDSRRYAALGDAVTVNVAEWIGRRIMAHVKERTAA